MAHSHAAPPGDAPDIRHGDIDAQAEENMREGTLAPRVFWSAAIIMAIFIGLTLAFPQKAKGIFDALQSDVISYFGWYYVAIVAFFVVFALYLGFPAWAISSSVAMTTNPPTRSEPGSRSSSQQVWVLV